MGQENGGIKSYVTNILLLVILVSLLCIPGYLCYKIFFSGDQEQQNNEDKKVEETEDTEEGIFEDTNDTQFSEKVPQFIESFPILENQQAYVAIQDDMKENDPPILIIYSHGSESVVTQDMNSPFMLELQEYGRYFSKHNYIFAASNQHGVSWGNEASLRDTANLVEWVRTNYKINPQIYMIGFSMGGLTSLNFASQNPEIVVKVALLAPTTRISEWNKQRAEGIKDIDIKIWHGDADEYVAYSSIQDFVTKLNSWGKDIELVTLEDKRHYDLDTEYMEDILQFFNQ